MTLVVSLRVHEGVVLAADSASTMVYRDANGQSVVKNVYSNANKIFNLYKGVPIGALTWGGGSIGEASISTLAKDFRARLSDSGDPIAIDPAAYTMLDVASKFAVFMQDTYTQAYGTAAQPDSFTGFIVAGYSSHAPKAEVYEITLTNGQINGPTLVPEFPSIYLAGQPNAAERLIFGVDPLLPNVLVNNLGVPQAQIDAIMQVIVSSLYTRLDNPAMPIQDAIDLAEFLVDLTIKYVRFSEGEQTVGGPIEIATITKHEKFKWIRRKHYYDATLNHLSIVIQ